MDTRPSPPITSALPARLPDVPLSRERLEVMCAAIRAHCISRKRALVLVGMMGAGKTAIGKRLAEMLRLNFCDVDAEIESGARMSIPEIFARHGEAYFRDGERRVIARLLREGPQVLATGGGAFMDASTRDEIAQRGHSIWLRPSTELLMRRVSKKSNRPLLKTKNPEHTLRLLIAQRYSIYAKTQFQIPSPDGAHEATLLRLIMALAAHLEDSAIPHEATMNGQNVDPAQYLPKENTSSAQPAPHAYHMSSAMSAPAFFSPTQNPPLTVPVAVSGHEYAIYIGDGLLDEAGARISALLAKDEPKRRAAIITDKHVAKFYLDRLQESLGKAGIAAINLVIPAGESAKSPQNFVNLCEGVIAARLERADFIIALGGGVVGDLAGFVAASVRRGMRFVQIPTTLLAQVDSAVGGKTGVNSVHGKNLIGAFYQPHLVIADTLCLDSLTPRDFAAGYAEVVKYGLINDAKFFAWLETHGAEIFTGGRDRIAAVAHCCRAKAGVVARDEKENGERALLNLGHTFAHALESGVAYDTERLTHGEAVAIGLVCALELSHFLGLCDGGAITRVERHLSAAKLPTRIGMIKNYAPTPEILLQAMGQDKKANAGALTFIVMRAIGEAFIAKNIPHETVLRFFAERGSRLFAKAPLL